MAQYDFVGQLRDLGHDVEDRGNGVVTTGFAVPLGRFAGETVRIGFEVPGDFPVQPPKCLHVSPRLLPLNPGGMHPAGHVLESSLGPDWQYWSRPLSHWQDTARTARAVMAHVRHLFDTQ